MTVAAINPLVEYIENGVSLNFAVPFPFRANGDLVVERFVGSAPPVTVTPTLVTGAGAPNGGLVSLPSTIAAARLRIRRRTTRTQTADYTPGDPFPAEVHEGALDKQMMVAQEIDASISDTQQRAVMVPVGEAISTLPAAADRAGKYLACDPTGKIVPASGTGNDGALRADVAARTGTALIGYEGGTLTDRIRQIFITPEDFRFPAFSDQGVMEQLAAALDDGVTAVIDGSYVITARISIIGKSNWVLRGSGTIKMADGAAVDDAHGIIRLWDCHNFLFEGVTLDGNRANRTPVESPGHNLRIRSCSYGVIKNVKSINSVTDGYYVASETPADKATHSHHLLFDNCYADNSFRNGMGLIQANNCEVRGGAMLNSVGTAPQAGIDIESNPGNAQYSNELLRITGVEIRGNAGHGIQISGPSDPRRIWITDCALMDNTAGALLLAGADIFVVRPLISGGGAGLARGVIDVPSSASEVGRIEISAPKFRNITTTTQSLLYVHAVSVGSVTMLNVDCDSCARIVDFQAPNCRLQGGVVGAATFLQGAVSFAAGAVRGEVSGLTLSNFNRTAILALANDVRIIENTLREPTANDATGVIRIASGSGVTVRANKIVRAASAAGYGVVSEVQIDRMQDNRVEGFTGNPYAITGTPIAASGNIANGALV